MATTTSYLQLTKPALTDQFDLNVMNANWDKIDSGCAKIGNLDGSRSLASASDDLNAGFEQMPAGIIRVGSNVQNSPGNGILLNLTGSVYNAQIHFANTVLNMPVLRVRAFRSTDAEITATWHKIPTFEEPDGYIRTGASYNDIVTLTLPTSYRGLLFLYNSGNAGGAYMISQPSTASSSAWAIPLGTAPSGITVTASAKTLVLQTSVSTACYPYLINLSGIPDSIVFSNSSAS